MSLALQNQIILGDCLEKMKDIPEIRILPELYITQESKSENNV